MRKNNLEVADLLSHFVEKSGKARTGAGEGRRHRPHALQREREGAD